MADPNRPGYYQPPTHQSYQPTSYAPDQYASGALTTRHHSPGDTYYPSQSNLQLSQSSYRPPSTDSKYLDPTSSHRSDRHHTHHHHKSRSHSRHASPSRSPSRSRSKSRTKEWGSTAVGAAAGGLLGNELGHGPLATIGGLVAGAYGAHELEKRHERHREKKRIEEGGRGYEDGGGERHHRRRSSGGLLDGLKTKVEGFLEPERREGKRRSRSHVGGGRKDYDYEDDGYDDERRSGSGRSGGGSGRRSRRDEYY